MPIPQNFKDAVDILASAITALTVLAAAVGYIITRHDQKAAGLKAMQQIDHMSTNCFPTMQKALVELNAKQDSANEKSDEQIKTLSSIDKGIAVLVDRGREA